MFFKLKKDSKFQNGTRLDSQWMDAINKMGGHPCMPSQHTANALMMSEAIYICAAKPFAMDLQAATMKAPGKMCD